MEGSQFWHQKMGLFSKIFGTYSDRQIKKIIPIVNKIESLADTFKAMSDSEMRAKTDEFKERLNKGETLDDILPEAFALVREAADRVLGKRPFRVQLIGGIILHQGRVAEMKTGEGKTIVAVLPSYLNALTGQGVHIVTVNEYLARVGCEEMGRVYEFLGLTTGLVVSGQTREDKQRAYNCDITYCTGNEVAFDYLRDNMVVYKKDMVQRGHAFVIVDEVDSILIDEARNPLIISGESGESTDLYEKADALVSKFKMHTVKEIDKKIDLDYTLVHCTAEKLSVVIAERVLSKGFDKIAALIDDKKSRNALLSGGQRGIEEYIFAYFADDIASKLESSKNNAEVKLSKAYASKRISDCIKDYIAVEIAPAILGDKLNRLENNYFKVRFADKALEEFTHGYVSGYLPNRIFDFAPDYIVDEKARNTMLTRFGKQKAQKHFGVEFLSDDDRSSEDEFDPNAVNTEAKENNAKIYHHIQQAMNAHGVMHCDVDYVVHDGQIIIVDGFTGRLTPGRRYNDGLHQAIEAKEKLEIRKENQTVATIAFQNYFRMYKKLSGMTGTAMTEEAEFREIYNLDVIAIPTNKPMIRKDHHDVLFVHSDERDKVVIQHIKDAYEKGQPVLVGTVSIEKSEDFSKKLKGAGVPHKVLNAKNHQSEAEIIAQAGRFKSVTISTNMAGRGTDILLGGNAEFMAKRKMRDDGYDEKVIALATGSSQSVSEEVLAARRTFKELYEKYRLEIEPERQKVIEAGGLLVIGTERHESRRIDNQLRGRAGRQGDPGESVFYVSFQDDLLRRFGGDKMNFLFSKLTSRRDVFLNMRLSSSVVEIAQKRVEAKHFARRKDVLAYDEVMNQQRNIIYSQRAEVLEGIDLRPKIEDMIRSSIRDNVKAYFSAKNQRRNNEASDNAYDVSDEGNTNADEKQVALEALKSKLGFLCASDDFDDDKRSADDLTSTFTNRALSIWLAKEKFYGEETMREAERYFLLRTVDVKWMHHLAAMDDLKNSVGLQSYAQRSPISEYRLISAEMFDDMITDIRDGTVASVLTMVIKKTSMERESVVKSTKTAHGQQIGNVSAKQKAQPVRAEKKIGRNELCPCGSGEKYKRCCGANKGGSK